MKVCFSFSEPDPTDPIETLFSVLYQSFEPCYRLANACCHLRAIFNIFTVPSTMTLEDFAIGTFDLSGSILTTVIK